jgi:hypothetical protein
MTKKDDPATLAALQAALDKGGSRRSPLFRWMLAHHDEFAALVEDERPDWSALTEAFASQGFVNAEGGPLRSEVVRQTWWRVQKHWAERKKSKKAAPLVVPVARVSERNVAPEDRAPETSAGSNDAAWDALMDEINRRSGRKA